MEYQNGSVHVFYCELSTEDGQRQSTCWVSRELHWLSCGVLSSTIWRHIPDPEKAIHPRGHHKHQDKDQPRSILPWKGPLTEIYKKQNRKMEINIWKKHCHLCLFIVLCCLFTYAVIYPTARKRNRKVPKETLPCVSKQICKLIFWLFRGFIFCKCKMM